MEYDMTIEWLTFEHQSIIIEQEYDGMEAVDGFSDPFEYGNGCTSVQPDFIMQG